MDKDKFHDIPEAISNNFSMESPNEEIVIHEGEFTLKNADKKAVVDGIIKFKWFPIPRVYFEGELETQNSSMLMKDLLSFNELFIDGIYWGKTSTTELRSSIGPSRPSNISGHFYGDLIVGDSSIPVTSINFSIPNLKEIFGETIEIDTYAYLGRITLEDEDLIITIDKKKDYQALFKNLRKTSGYILLYNGSIKSRKGSISYKELEELRLCIAVFFTFLNGRRIHPLLFQGIYEEEVKWTDYAGELFEAYKDCKSWSLRHLRVKDSDYLNSLWISFRKLWKRGKETQNFLSTIVQWYAEANNRAGLINGAIIFAQTGLELIYNWWIVEEKGMIAGRDSRNLSAANKIRLILSQLNLSTEIPEAFNDFKDVQQEINSQGDEAPETFVYIRNALVHSREGKRKALEEINIRARNEALELSLWYLELSLLKILDYEGYYLNRCINDPIRQKERVPWVEGN